MAHDIPLAEKDCLTKHEAAIYWNLSCRKFNRFLADGPYSFTASYGPSKFILRAAFDKYLQEHPEIKEALTRGKSRQKRFQA